MLDLRIQGAQLIDGTGAPARRADVGITGETITALGDLSREPAGRTLEASGLVLAPGFIDVHSHSDWRLWANRRAESKIRQRVTRAMLPLLEESTAPRIINVSSGAGQLDGEPQPWAPAYSISKTALNMLTQQLTAALPRIMVNSMCPGWCRTEMGGPDAPLSPEDGADTVVWLALDAPPSISGSFVKQRQVIPW